MEATYKLEFINDTTQEVLRDEIIDTKEEMERIIRFFENANNISEPSYIIDNQTRILEAKYVTYNVFQYEQLHVYKLYFETKLTNKQLHLEH